VRLRKVIGKTPSHRPGWDSTRLPHVYLKRT
jgi:hypothetical protein